QIAMMYGRAFWVEMIDGRRIYSVAARQDVSDSLDTISPLPGSLLIRTAEGWRYVSPPIETGKPLVSTADGLAEWGDVDSGGHWGEILGTITDQTDLMALFDAADAALTAGLATKQDSGLAALKANNLSDLASITSARTNLSVYSKADVDALLATGGVGGAKARLGSYEGFIASAASPATNQYLMKLVICDTDFAISKIVY